MKNKKLSTINHCEKDLQVTSDTMDNHKNLSNVKRELYIENAFPNSRELEGDGIRYVYIGSPVVTTGGLLLTANTVTPAPVAAVATGATALALGVATVVEGLKAMNEEELEKHYRKVRYNEFYNVLSDKISKNDKKEDSTISVSSSKKHKDINSKSQRQLEI